MQCNGLIIIFFKWYGCLKWENGNSIFSIFSVPDSPLVFNFYKRNVLFRPNVFWYTGISKHLTWWFIIARRHMIQTCTSSRASPMFSFCVYLAMPREALMVLERFRLFMESRASPESRLELFSLFSSCSLLEVKESNRMWFISNFPPAGRRK